MSDFKDIQSLHQWILLHCHRMLKGWIPRNFKKFSFSSLICHFWAKIAKMITSVNSWISPFQIFHENKYRNCHFQEIGKIIYRLNMLKSGNPAIFVIFLENDNLGLKMKILLFLGIHPSLNIQMVKNSLAPKVRTSYFLWHWQVVPSRD